MPAIRAIPVVVRNTLRPAAEGSRIIGTPVPGSTPVRAIVREKTGLSLVSVVNPKMLMQPGYLAQVFAVAARHGIDVGLVATSEVSITMTTDATDLSGFSAELRAHGEVLVESGQGIIGVVGHGIADALGVPGQVFGTLAELGVRVRVISQGAIKVNIAFVVADADVPRSVRGLHAAFFGADGRERAGQRAAPFSWTRGRDRSCSCPRGASGRGAGSAIVRPDRLLSRTGAEQVVHDPVREVGFAGERAPFDLGFDLEHLEFPQAARLEHQPSIADEVELVRADQPDKLATSA